MKAQHSYALWTVMWLFPWLWRSCVGCYGVSLTHSWPSHELRPRLKPFWFKAQAILAQGLRKISGVRASCCEAPWSGVASPSPNAGVGGGIEFPDRTDSDSDNPRSLSSDLEAIVPYRMSSLLDSSAGIHNAV